MAAKAAFRRRRVNYRTNQHHNNRPIKTHIKRDVAADLKPMRTRGLSTE